jgi:hypothetical protein
MRVFILSVVCTRVDCLVPVCACVRAVRTCAWRMCVYCTCACVRPVIAARCVFVPTVLVSACTRHALLTLAESVQRHAVSAEFGAASLFPDGFIAIEATHALFVAAATRLHWSSCSTISDASCGAVPRSSRPGETRVTRHHEPSAALAEATSSLLILGEQLHRVSPTRCVYFWKSDALRQTLTGISHALTVAPSLYEPLVAILGEFLESQTRLGGSSLSPYPASDF